MNNYYSYNNKIIKKTELYNHYNYVSRGGFKLAEALDYFKLDVTNLNCLDVGANKGGFTDCLVQRGVYCVTTIDVGHNLLAYKLRINSKIKIFERTNARNLSPKIAPGPFDLIVIDVSFISLTYILPNIVPRMKIGGGLLCLVKPQFEANKNYINKGGIVKNKKIRIMTVDKITNCLINLGLKIYGQYQNSITGISGNIEYFLLSRRHS